MNDFPNNSSRAKNSSDIPEEPEVQIENIVLDGVVVSRPSRFKKFRRSFIAGDASTVAEHVLWNLLLPAARDAASNMASTFIDMMIYGEKRNYSNTGHPFAQQVLQQNRGLGSNSTINYGNISTGNRLALTPPGATHEHTGQGRFSPNDITVPTRAQAEAILARMFEVLESYNVVTVANLYGMVGVSTNPMDSRWGWTNLDTADLKRVRNGVQLVLPPPIDLGN